MGYRLFGLENKTGQTWLQDLEDFLGNAGHEIGQPGGKGGGKLGGGPEVPGESARGGGLDGARALFITGIALKQVAANLPEGHALASAVDRAIADWEDDYCGTPPRPLPTLELAVSLAAFASSLQAGNLRSAIQVMAGQLAQKAFGPEPAAQPVVRAA
jgi:hypothetical protein